jgi:hypothetical protein
MGLESILGDERHLEDAIVSRNGRQLEPQAKPGISNAQIENARRRLLVLVVTADQRGNRMSTMPVGRMGHRISIGKLDGGEATHDHPATRQPRIPTMAGPASTGLHATEPAGVGLGAPLTPLQESLDVHRSFHRSSVMLRLLSSAR